MKVSFRDRLLGKIKRTNNECWEFTGFRMSNGYGRISGHGGKSVLVHRGSWTEFCGSIPPGMCVLHRCDNPPCVNPAHLFLGTSQDNTNDMIAKCRKVNAVVQPTKQGERHHNAKLTESQVLEIRARRKENHRVLALEFGIGRVHVRRILRGERWAHLV